LPYGMAINKITDQVWVLYSQGGTVVDSAIKLQSDGAGNVTSTGVIISGLTDALDIAVSPDGTTVLIAVGGSAQQVWAYNNSDGSVKTAFGTSGKFGQAGGYSSGPAVMVNKFMFFDLIGFQQGSLRAWVTFAPDGSWWLRDAGNCRTLHFSAG